MCISVNHREAAWASADILMFSSGRRVLRPDGAEVVHFRYTPDGWSDFGWVNGECGEWEDRQYPPGCEVAAGLTCQGLGVVIGGDRFPSRSDTPRANRLLVLPASVTSTDARKPKCPARVGPTTPLALNPRSGPCRSRGR